MVNVSLGNLIKQRLGIEDFYKGSMANGNIKLQILSTPAPFINQHADIKTHPSTQIMMKQEIAVGTEAGFVLPNISRSAALIWKVLWYGFHLGISIWIPINHKEPSFCFEKEKINIKSKIFQSPYLQPLNATTHKQMTIYLTEADCFLGYLNFLSILRAKLSTNSTVSGCNTHSPRHCKGSICYDCLTYIYHGPV